MTISDTLLSKLKDKSLVTDKALVAGEWLAASRSEERRVGKEC